MLSDRNEISLALFLEIMGSESPLSRSEGEEEKQEVGVGNENCVRTMENS